jgi:hypothetical protein
MFCLSLHFGSHRKLDPGRRCPRQPHTGALAVRSSHGGSVLPSSQLPSLAPHGPRHRPAIAAAQPNRGACGSGSSGAQSLRGIATGPGRLRLGVRALVPKGSGWNPGATAVEGPPNRRRQRAWRSPGPSPCPLRAPCHHAPTGGAAHHSSCDPVRV